MVKGACSEQSSILDFGKRQLEKHGWTEGKGLGKDESGRANAIKVGVKNNTLGVGFDVGKEFTYNWWDHLFNKAASNIVVKESKSGVQVSKKDAGDGVFRPKKILKEKGKDLYYGRFVKAGDDDLSHPSETESPTVKTKFSDEELFKACGGRTAHKSARHGHKLSGKLKRVAEQEDEVCPVEQTNVKRKKRSKNGKITSRSTSSCDNENKLFFHCCNDRDMESQDFSRDEMIQSELAGKNVKLDRPCEVDVDQRESSEGTKKGTAKTNADYNENECTSKPLESKEVKKKSKKRAKKKKVKECS